jgi:alcohol dehydrogenase class IV
MNSILSSNWNYPTSVRFGLGRITELAEACKSVGMKKPLLITDPGLAALPMVDNAIARNDAEGLATGLFSNIKPNPVSRNVDDGVKAYLAGGHDGIIAWGGGSGIDAAKAVALMAGQSRPIWDFEDVDDNWLRVNTTHVAPIVAVPTTSGTGSEVGRASVITNEETQTKRVIFHPTMLPKIVICDPELLIGLPTNLTAYTGMDALVHCFEAYCAPGYHPMAEGIALEGMRLVHDWLPTAVKDGSDIEARAQMMSAAVMGATAFQKGLGAVHSLSHPVGSVYDTHHGLTNAVFMPYVMNFNQSAIKDQMDLLARYLGLPGTGYSAVMDWVLELRQTFNIANTPHELGVEENRLDELSEMAANDPTAGGNPIPVNAADMKVMYEAAMAGKL